MTWVLSVDPMEPGSEWDNPPLGEPLLEDIPAPKRRWGRRKAKTVAATAAVGTAVGVGESAAVRDVTPPTLPPSPTSPSSATGTITPPAAEPAEPASDVAASAPAAVATPAVEKSAAAPTATGKGAPTTDAPPPPAAPVSTDAVGDEPKGPPQTKEPADSEQAAPTPERPRRRSRLVVLGVALLAVIGAIGYLVANRNTSSTPTSTSPPPTTLPDAALVASVNLHVADLPAGWTTAGPAAPPLHLPAAPPSAEAQAATTLSSCLSVPTATITGLFAGASLPGQTATGISPTFIQSVGDPGVQMHSVTTTIGAEAQAQSYAAPFQNPDFVACYGQFQRTVAAAAIPGATATVQAVTLPPPAGVKSFGYITTVTSSQGTEVFGQAYMIGGRIVTDLMPATNGPQIPSGDFTHAYDAVGGRIAASVQK